MFGLKQRAYLMATEVIITGTGNPGPSANRAGPGVLVRYGDISMQFDAGRSTVQRLAGAGQSLLKLTVFFATHHHSDHLTGLQDLVMSRWLMDRTDETDPLPLVVPEGPCVKFAERMLDPWGEDLAIRREHTGRTRGPAYEVVSFPYPETGQLAQVWSQGDVRVLAGQVRHEPVHPAVGFRIETPDGVVAITGDTLVCDEINVLAEGADVLVYEAMLFEAIETEPSYRHFIMDYHADTRLIGAQAQALGVPNLVLTHLIPPPETPELRQAYMETIRAGGYTGDLAVADDLHTVTLG
jgi:ribonuclease Z